MGDIISVNQICQILEDHKAENVKFYRSHIVDWAVIASGTSTKQVKALAEQVVTFAKDIGARYSIEGLNESNWILIDLDYIIVHLFLDEIRAYYNLDELLSCTAKNRPSSSFSNEII